MAPYDVAFKQQYEVQDSPYYPHYTPFDPKGHIHTPYAPGGYSVPGATDWGTYYREDTTRALTNPAAATSSGNGPWSNSGSNASVSSVQLDSPITPL